MLPAIWRRWLEILSLAVAAFCVLVAVVERLATIHLLGRVETLMELAIIAMLVALWAVQDEIRAARPK